MKKVTKFNFKTLLVLFLSIALCLSTALSVACDDNDSSSSSPSNSSSSVEDTNPTDAQTLKNGDFEFSTFTKEAKDFPVGTSINWIRSNDSIVSSAVSSSYSSGIIDTKTEAYDAIKESKKLPEVNPGTPFEVMSDEEKAEFANLEDYEANEDGKPANGTKILMIHNEVKNADIKGTAQKFTSSTSLSLGRHEVAKLSIWVKTVDLESSFYTDTKEFGAYIAIQNTIGSVSKAPAVIKNINTNGEWVKYTIYLQPSDFATSSFKVVLGLGFGSKELKDEYVQGYAFFDNASFELINLEDLQSDVMDLGQNNPNCVGDSFSLYTQDNGLFVDAEAKDLIASEANIDYSASTITDKGYADRFFIVTHARMSFPGLPLDLGNNLASGVTNNHGEIAGTVNYAPVADVLKAIHGENHEEKAPMYAVSNALYINHGDNYASTSYVTAEFTAKANTITKYSFWVKAETKHPTQKGLTITLNDLDTGNVEAIDTVIASSVTTNDYEDENNYNWIEYVLYVSNTLDDEDRTFTLTFDFGTTDKNLTDDIYSLTQGYAIITEPTGYVISEEDYSKVDSSYSYTAKASLTADLPNGIEDTEDAKDSYNFTYGANDAEAIKEGKVATNINSYRGIVGGSNMVGGQNENAYSHEKVTAGLVNSEFYTGLDALSKIGENKHLQPLMIKTEEGAPSFGFVHTGSSLSLASTLTVTVKVFVEGDAEAYIYLASTDALEQFSVLGHSALEKELAIKVTAADMPANGDWLTVTLALTAGENSIPYRVELWNGARNSTENAKVGTVYFDQVTTNTSNSLNDLVNIEFVDETATETSYTQKDTVTTTITIDEDGNETSEEHVQHHEPEVVVYEYAHAILIDLTTLDVTSEKEIINDLRTEVDSSTSEETSDSLDEPSSFNWALQLTSIIIAAVLIVLLLFVLGRMLYKKYLNKKGASKAYYNRDSREKAGLAIEAKKAKKTPAVVETAEEPTEEDVKPYDYDNMENNIEEEVVVDEAVVEEIPAEEAVEEPATEEVVEPAEEATEEPASTEEKPEDGSAN